MQHEEEDQVLLNDHEYSIPNKALETSDKVAEDFIKEAVSINTSINSYNSHDSLDKQLLSVCKLGKSVLFKSSAKDLSERNWFLDIGREMLQHCPEFLSLLLSAIVLYVDEAEKQHFSGEHRGLWLSIYTLHPKELLHRLNKVHITMSDESKRHIMRDLSNHSDEMIKEQIAKGNDGKLNGDNLDIYVITNDVETLTTYKVPVGGDQLTRVRLKERKSLRAGAFTAEDRLEHLTPIVVEMFPHIARLLEVTADQKDGLPVNWLLFCLLLLTADQKDGLPVVVLLFCLLLLTADQKDGLPEA
ncbi:unnamed protein product [Mytilus coruscus]|uniref:Uncharacterized protein n=1 Tax=Mytilus coruscus TaxID=42192 RepID=A0A6J8CK50_MYTCO|nr:unnamed protein product [Mytilus coruscus]